MVTSPQHRPHRLLLDVETAMPPMGLNRTVGSYNSDADFEDNMVIVLGVLFCALICALGLNSAVRCILRCGHSLGFWTLEQIPELHQLPSTSNTTTASATTTTTGLNKSALRQIPVMAYESGLNLDGTDCSICLGEFTEGEKVRVVPKCSHVFHAVCIDTWLLSNSSCPLCRQALEFHSWVGLKTEQAVGTT